MKSKLTFSLALAAGALIGYLAANSDFGSFKTAEAKNDDSVTVPTNVNLKVGPGTQTKPACCDGNLKGKLMFAHNQQQVAALSAAS